MKTINDGIQLANRILKNAEFSYQKDCPGDRSLENKYAYVTGYLKGKLGVAISCMPEDKLNLL